MSTLFATESVTEPAVAAEVRQFGDMTQCRDEIERLWIEGYSTKEIAAKLGGKPLDVARNLREIRKRWQRADQRREAAQGARCRDVYREAMEGWRRSQRPKEAKTRQYQNDRPVKVTTREENSAGQCSFLRTALSALKALDQLAAKKPATASEQPSRDADEMIVSLLNLMTPEQFERLDPEQAESCRRAIDACGKKRGMRAACRRPARGDSG